MRYIYILFLFVSFLGFSQITSPVDPGDPWEPGDPTWPGPTTPEKKTYYYDDDGDGYGNPAISEEFTMLELIPSGYVLANKGEDYDDSDPFINIKKNWYPDFDKDGLGDMSKIGVFAYEPPGYGTFVFNINPYIENNNDCNDTKASVGSGCERRKIYIDNDGDGYGGSDYAYVIADHPTPEGFACNNLDEDDTTARKKNREPLYSRPPCSSPNYIVHGDAYYEDLDGDGLGAGPGFTGAADYDYDNDGDLDPLPDHFVRNNGDSNDNDPNIGSVYVFRDEDEDEYGDMKANLANGNQLLLGENTRVIALVPIRKFPRPTSGCLYTRMTSNSGDPFVVDPGIPGDEPEGETLYGHTIPEGYVVDNTDCDDQDPYVRSNCPDFDDENYTYTKTYGVDRLKTRSLAYYNDLGKNYISYNWHTYQWNNLWVSQTRFDEYGRPAINSFKVPIGKSLLGTTPSTWWSTQTELTASYAALVENPLDYNSLSINTTGLAPSYYNDTSFWNSYYDFFNGGWVSRRESSFRPESDYPYIRNVFDRLNPGNMVKNIGGQKINNEWKNGFSYTMPVSQELYYAFGLDYFKESIPEDLSISFPSGKSLTMKAQKTVSIDPEGKTVISISDLEGNLLVAARSGSQALKKQVVSTIGEQNYVDIHIGEGCGSNISYNGGSSRYKVFNLRTGQQLSSITSLPAGVYRIEYIGNVSTRIPFAHYNSSTGQIVPLAGTPAITYKINYYDYSLNYYDKAGRLRKTLPPLGFDDSYQLSDGGSPQHNEALLSEYDYNTLGQLVNTKSPDEGESWFKYREDGQIRYSQNSIQATENKVSYTNYDDRARPEESGVLQLSSGNFESLDPDASLAFGTTSELTQTVYDKDPSALQMIQYQNMMQTAGIPYQEYQQEFVSGNVNRTSNEYSTTWYSYDIYGRLTWLVQDIDGLGVKTIDYEYDKDGNVKKVIYQKHKPEEIFVHKYQYNTAGMLTRAYTSTNGQDFKLQGNYSYYTDGKLKRLEIGNDLQGLDYTYTLGGALKSINHPSLSQAKDPGRDNDDLFGMTIDYYKGDYRSTLSNIRSPQYGTNSYTGNIKGTRWNTHTALTNHKEKLYYYNYNPHNWLERARFGSSDPNGGISLGSEYRVDNLTYDANGNLLSLRRNKDNSGNGTAMDNLRYRYYPNSNRLQRVDDYVTLNTMVDDIKDQNGNNYTYNDLGQLVSNAQDAISYTYNTAGLVTAIHNTLTGNPVVKFMYDDKGKRLKKEGYINGQLSYTDYYVRDASGSPMAIYRNSTLKENPIYGGNRLGIHYREDNSDVYQLTDHLGNVRAVVTNQGGNTLAVVSKADYYPGGMAMPGRNVQGDYRYGYQGEYSEKDPETGLNAFELRMYDSRINRWISPDPYGQYASPYLAMGNNWINKVDPDGGCDEPPCMPVIQLDEVVITASGGGNSSWSLMDSVHTGLDIVGLVPGLGEIADGINALTYLAEGDYTNAALSTAAMVPFAGYAANAVKFSKTANKVVDIYTATRNAKKYVGQTVDITKRYSKNVRNAMGVEVKLSVPKRLANAVEQQMISVHGTRKFGNGLADNVRNQMSLKNQVKNKDLMMEARDFLDNNYSDWMSW